MKKLTALLLAVLISAGSLAGCGGSQKQDGKFKIIATIFPEYDWVKNITKGVDSVEVSMLMDSGADLHSFQPTADDIYQTTSCDVFVYTGGESDKWVADALKSAPKVTALSVMELMGDRAKEEQVVEGMQTEEEEEHEFKDETEYDEHVWLSVKNAETLCQKICDTLCEKDSANKAQYTANTKAYIESLDKLDKAYESAVKSAKHDTLLFADRFPFRYLTDDYDLKYYAAFVGCSAETEASFETIKFLADKLNEKKLPAVLTIDGSDQKIAQTVISTAGAKNVDILTLDSMQSKTAKDAQSGVTYLKLMEQNLEVIKKALQ